MNKNTPNLAFMFFALAISLLITVSSAQVKLDSLLFTRYTFDGNTKSSTSSAWDLTNYGATLTTDHYGNANSAYYFNGSSYMQGNFPATGYSGCTVSAWINTVYTNNNVAILGYPAGVAYLNRFTVKHFMAMFDQNSGNNASGDESVSSVENGWTFVAATNDGSVTKLYVNGVFENSFPETLINSAGNGAMVVGNLYGANNTFFVGSIDDVRIYGRALNSNEIMALYQLPQKSAIDENSSPDISFDLFPNPVDNGKMNIRSNNFNGNCNLIISDIQGKLLLNEHLKFDNSSEKTIDIQYLQNGIYNARLQTGSALVIKTFVVQ